MKLFQYNDYSVSTMDTDGLGITSYSTEYAPMHFSLFMVNPLRTKFFIGNINI